MGVFDWSPDDGFGWQDLALFPLGVTKAAWKGGKWVADKAGIDTGGGDAAPPAYNPDPNNFTYGLGSGIDANGVVHPTPEELARGQKGLNDQIASIRLGMNTMPEGSPERAKAEEEILRLQNEFNEWEASGQDNYAAQRTREFVGKQEKLDALTGGLIQQGQSAYNREAPQMSGVTSNGQSYLEGADANSRMEQLKALSGLKAFANRGQGPSAAQAQLQAGTDMAAHQQYGMARSQPGGGGAALRNAAFNAAGISGNAANSAAMLRAQEDQAYRQQQLAALGAVQQGAGTMRTGDQSFAQTQAGQANFDANLGMTTQQQNLQAQLASRQQNDAAALGFTQAGLASNGQSMDYENMRDTQAINQSQTGTNLEQAKATAAGQQFQAQQAQQAQANRRRDEYFGMAGAVAGYAGGGPAGGVAGYNVGKQVSDVRAKKNIEKADVLKALGGQVDRIAAPYQMPADGGETTRLSPEDEARFREWAARQNVTDIDHPDSHYDYRGFWRENPTANIRGGRDHFPDTYKQHGHPTFSTESRYSKSFTDGGYWEGDDQFQPAPVPKGGYDLAALDAAYAREGGAPNLRPAQGYSYDYKDPAADGAGRYVGPMAQDLEHLPGVVQEGPGGKKSVDPGRLTLVNTAALSQQQREMDAIRRRQEQLMALNGGMPAAGAFPMPNVRAPDYAALDQAAGR